MHKTWKLGSTRNCLLATDEIDNYFIVETGFRRYFFFFPLLFSSFVRPVLEVRESQTRKEKHEKGKRNRMWLQIAKPKVSFISHLIRTSSKHWNGKRKFNFNLCDWYFKPPFLVNWCNTKLNNFFVFPLTLKIWFFSIKGCVLVQKGGNHHYNPINPARLCSIGSRIDPPNWNLRNRYKITAKIKLTEHFWSYILSQISERKLKN